MPVETQTGVPCQFAAGTTQRLSLGYNDYPASGWTLSFILLGPSALTVAGVAAGDDFTVTLTAVQTAALSPGQYNWTARVSDGTDVAIAARGVLSITADLSNTTVGPWRTRYNNAVTALDSLTISGLASVNVEGQSFTYATRDGLQMIVDRLESKAIEEDRLLGRAAAGNVKRIRMIM